MPELTIELSVGDVVQIGNQLLTVIDVDGDEVSFRIDDASESEHAPAQPPRK